jgi:hypothetical protein
MLAQRSIDRMAARAIEEEDMEDMEEDGPEPGWDSAPPSWHYDVCPSAPMVGQPEAGPSSRPMPQAGPSRLFTQPPFAGPSIATYLPLTHEQMVAYALSKVQTYPQVAGASSSVVGHIPAIPWQPTFVPPAPLAYPVIHESPQWPPAPPIQPAIMAMGLGAQLAPPAAVAPAMPHPAPAPAVTVAAQTHAWLTTAAPFAIPALPGPVGRAFVQPFMPGAPGPSSMISARGALDPALTLAPAAFHAGQWQVRAQPVTDPSPLPASASASDPGRLPAGAPAPDEPSAHVPFDTLPTWFGLGFEESFEG